MRETSQGVGENEEECLVSWGKSGRIIKPKNGNG
jgi:hypothetical protein